MVLSSIAERRRVSCQVWTKILGTTIIGFICTLCCLERRSEDLLLLRSPGREFLLKGPPKDLVHALQMFAARTEQCRKAAVKLATEFGFSGFLRE